MIDRILSRTRSFPFSSVRPIEGYYDYKGTDSAAVAVGSRPYQGSARVQIDDGLRTNLRKRRRRVELPVTSFLAFHKEEPLRIHRGSVRPVKTEPILSEQQYGTAPGRGGKHGARIISLETPQGAEAETLESKALLPLDVFNPVFAGSASGVLSTIQQVGSAIGVIFFGQLGAGADASSRAAIPQLEARLNTVGLPVPAVSALTTGFQTCFRDRSSQNDPNALPLSCAARPNGLPAAAVQAVSEAISRAARVARQHNFLEAILIALRFQLGIYAICFGLVFLLPSSKNRAS